MPFPHLDSDVLVSRQTNGTLNLFLWECISLISLLVHFACINHGS